VEREFDKSLKQKEEEVERIEQRLASTQEALQMVRYGAVANYYAGATLKVRLNNRHPSLKGILLQQKRLQPELVAIHPATRRLLRGKKPTRASIRAAAKQETPADTLVKAEVTSEVAEVIKPCYVPPKEPESVTKEPRGQHYKTCRRFVVGNVSKWIQCDQRDQDLATHKWMMYVRGDRDHPDVSDVVSKVRFLIHPSYHPNDLVEVNKPPFHLTRRGWGEFPARVQLHFGTDARDKPVDVIHHLKLDKTYTGMQTLGAETIVDVWLHDKEKVKVKKEAVKPTRAIIDQTENPSEGWVIPHEDVSDVIDQSMLYFEVKQEPKVNGTSAKVNGTPAGSSTEVNGTPAKANGSSTEVNGTPAKANGSSTEVNGTPAKANGSSTEVNGTPAKANGSSTEVNGVQSSEQKQSEINGAHGEVKQEPTSSPCRPRTTYVKCMGKNGKQFVLPLTIVPKKAPSEASQATNGHSNVLAKSLPPGTSLLKKNMSLAKKETLSFSAELAKSFPDVPLSSWLKITGNKLPEDREEMKHFIKFG